LVWAKGVQEFVEAAGLVRATGIEAKFILLGEPDGRSASSVPRSKLEEWHRQGIIEWWGWREDTKEILTAAHVVCLPSYYREGVPKVLIEAAALGRPIVTTDWPGCREIVKDRCNGLLVPPKNSSALAGSLITLLSDPSMRRAMGRAGRERFERQFSLDIVLDHTLQVYAEVMECGGGKRYVNCYESQLKRPGVTETVASHL
jgi:glycosyltransferase involved in cell wall biosynthesis